MARLSDEHLNKFIEINQKQLDDYNHVLKTFDPLNDDKSRYMESSIGIKMAKELLLAREVIKAGRVFLNEKLKKFDDA